MSFSVRFYVMPSMHWLKFALPLAIARAQGEGREILQEKTP